MSKVKPGSITALSDFISVRLQPKPSQVKPKTGCKSATALLIHLLLSSSSSFFLYIYNWTTSNAYISVNSQPMWVKFWILHLMTNPNKVYDTTLNLKHTKSQLISTTSNAYILVNSQPIWVQIWILHLMTSPNKVYDTT